MNRHKNISKECLNGSLVTEDIQTNIQRTDHFQTSFPGQPGKTHGAMPLADWCQESTIPRARQILYKQRRRYHTAAGILTSICVRPR